MKAGIIAFSIAVAMAAPAAAQTTTDCTSWGSSLHCQTSAPPSSGMSVDWSLLGKPADPIGSYAEGQRIAAERAAEQRAWANEQRAQAETNRENQERAAERREDQERHWREIDAGSLISEGHCDQARANALTAGDLELAAHVAGLCPAVNTRH